jgi:hypothetical protein
MARAPEKDKAETNRKTAERDRERRREAREPGTSGARKEPSDDIDPREEEGWTQPESSAQKGVLPDEG